MSRNSKLGLRREFKVPGAKYAYWLRGQGNLVVLLPGWPVTSYHWRHLIPFLNKSGYRTLAIDLKGLGESTFAWGSLSKEAIAGELLALIRSACGTRTRYSIIGHDWGGSVALALARLDSGFVDRLIVEEEIPPGVQANIPQPGASRYPQWHGAFHRQEGLAERLLEGKESIYVSYFLRLRADPRTLSKPVQRHYLKLYSGAHKTKTGLGYYRTISEDSLFFDKLRRSKLKTRVLAIGGNHAMGRAVGDAIRQLSIHASSITLNQSGHYPAEEEPEKFNRVVLRFLSKKP